MFIVCSMRHLRGEMYFYLFLVSTNCLQEVTGPSQEIVCVVSGLYGFETTCGSGSPSEGGTTKLMGHKIDHSLNGFLSEIYWEPPS